MGGFTKVALRAHLPARSSISQLVPFMTSRLSISFASLLFVLAVAHASAAQAPIAGIPPLRLTAIETGQAAQRIDEAIIAQARELWEKQESGTLPAQRKPFELPPEGDDATFLRRVTLDLLAQNPEAKVMRAFLADTDTARRGKMVDRLLLEPASAARRFTRLADMLRVKDTVLGMSLRPYAAWLHDACASAMPYDQLVRELVTASGEVHTNPATGWLLGEAGDCTKSMTEALRVFLDEDIHCARCHDHPYNDWTQMQFYQFAACLGGAQVLRSGPQGAMRLWPADPWVEAPKNALAAGERLLIADAPKASPLVLPSKYKYKDGKTGDVVRPALWQWNGDVAGAKKTMGNVRADKLRGEFATWLTGNQRFAEVAALRTWISLFGWPGDASAQSLEFTDGERMAAVSVYDRSCWCAGARNLPGWMTDQFLEDHGSSADRRFLRALAQELVRVRYDLREFERILCHTAAYQRQSITSPLAMNLRPIAPLLRRLPAETVWNNLVLVQSDGAIPVAPLSHELAQVPDAEHPSRALGRGARESGDDSLPLITHRIVRLMMNGDPVARASDADSPLVRRLRQTQPADVAVDEAFLAVLARLPSHPEKMKTMDHVIAQPATGWSDVVWSLLNTSEFLFQR